MSLDYRILSEALEELHDAASYIEAEREGFGLKLLNEHEATVDFALQQPTAGTPVELPVVYETRRFQMKRFPYSLFTAHVGDELVVFAVSHHKRAPTYWARRLLELDHNG
ncbi:MAG: type II toxin-antitoxin system RelE/ParE family toxin [Myxococcales bacterium]|nr:type II toxin-antitoxin system RelE/ParE family toxin [Myxococcales bacterium]MDD9964860.1 type II toxin-antitoxin system RelE/ParE family toxin [Myxococcales bacterium]